MRSISQAKKAKGKMNSATIHIFNSPIKEESRSSCIYENYDKLDNPHDIDKTLPNLIFKFTLKKKKKKCIHFAYLVDIEIDPTNTELAPQDLNLEILQATIDAIAPPLPIPLIKSFNKNP